MALMKEEIYSKTVFGTSFGDGTYKALTTVAPWLPATEKAWIRTFEVVVYDCKNAQGQPVPQPGWFGVGNSYMMAGPSPGNEFLFNWIEPGASRARTQFPAGCGMSFPRSPSDSPTIKLFGFIPSSIASFTWFLVMTYTKEPVA